MRGPPVPLLCAGHPQMPEGRGHIPGVPGPGAAVWVSAAWAVPQGLVLAGSPVCPGGDTAHPAHVCLHRWTMNGTPIPQSRDTRGRSTCVSPATGEHPGPAALSGASGSVWPMAGGLAVCAGSKGERPVEQR